MCHTATASDVATGFGRCPGSPAPGCGGTVGPTNMPLMGFPHNYPQMWRIPGDYRTFGVPMRANAQVRAGLTGFSAVSTLVQSSLGAMALQSMGRDRHCALALRQERRRDRADDDSPDRHKASGTVGCPPTRGVLTVAKGKRTFQPNNRRRARVHGFRLRMRTRAGRNIVSSRRRKGRANLTA